MAELRTFYIQLSIGTDLDSSSITWFKTAFGEELEE
jgi:hypothetical protein